ncbi:MAG: ABC transporter ATP-binding protein [Nitrospinae bacterium]|nr:ABC transporter ATP-binding protein [Nitrospinota bacterium]
MSEREDILISVHGLYKSFKKDSRILPVLKGIDLRIRRGEMIGIVGVSGAGKSTLLHLLGAIDRPSSGDIRFDGIDIFKMSDTKIAEFRNKRIGFVFQLHHLLPEFTSIENTMMPALIMGRKRNEAIERAKQILTDVGLRERFHHKPGELSGGEQQRVAIARALVNNPDIVLADEPTGNLDSETGRSIQELMCRLNRDKKQTFIIVTHNETIASKMDNILRLVDGRIL